MSLTARAVAIGLLVLAAIAGWWRLTAHFEAKGYARAQAEARDHADAQAERFRQLQRAAELRYTVAAEVRERVIVETIVEVRHASQSLATCPVPERARGLLNRAARCAADPAAACGPDQPLRDPA